MSNSNDTGREATNISAPPIDPTDNVKALVILHMNRQDDLRDAEGRRVNDVMAAESRRMDEVLQLRSEFSEKLRIQEQERINAIRSVDVNAVAVASEKANQQAGVLATQVAASAEALRVLVATTASTIAQQLAQITTQFNERLAAVEKANYEGVGKTTLTDPMLSRLADEMKVIQATLATTQGKTGVTDPMVKEVVAELKTLNMKTDQSAGREGISTPLIATIAALLGGMVIFLVEHFAGVR
jgi:hypothetical protein